MSDTSNSKASTVNNDWDHRFAFNGEAVGTRSLPQIKPPKPYIARNGSEVRSVLKTKSTELKHKKVARRRNRTGANLEVVASSLTPVQKHGKHSSPAGARISFRQQGKIASLRGRARPLSLPLLRKECPLPGLGAEKSYSARDSAARTPGHVQGGLQIDVSLDMDSTAEKQQWREFREITEDCQEDNLCHLTRLFCIGASASLHWIGLDCSPM